MLFQWELISLCLAQLPRTGRVVPRHDQVHAVRGVRVQSTGVPPGTSGAFPLQLLPGQSGPPRGGVHSRQVRLIGRSVFGDQCHVTPAGLT